MGIVTLSFGDRDEASAQALRAEIEPLGNLISTLLSSIDTARARIFRAESGAIEQDADMALYVHTEEYYDREDPSLAA
jgi:hypothetical protein